MWHTFWALWFLFQDGSKETKHVVRNDQDMFRNCTWLLRRSGENQALKSLYRPGWQSPPNDPQKGAVLWRRGGAVSGRREEGVVVEGGVECVWVEGGVECVCVWVGGGVGWAVWSGAEGGKRRARLWGFVWRTRRARRNVDLYLNSFHWSSQKSTSQQKIWNGKRRTIAEKQNETTLYQKKKINKFTFASSFVAFAVFNSVLEENGSSTARRRRKAAPQKKEGEDKQHHPQGRKEAEKLHHRKGGEENSTTHHREGESKQHQKGGKRRKQRKAAPPTAAPPTSGEGEKTAPAMRRWTNHHFTPISFTFLLSYSITLTWLHMVALFHLLSYQIVKEQWQHHAEEVEEGITNQKKDEEKAPTREMKTTPPTRQNNNGKKHHQNNNTKKGRNGREQHHPEKDHLTHFERGKNPPPTRETQQTGNTKRRRERTTPPRRNEETATPQQHHPKDWEKHSNTKKKKARHHLLLKTNLIITFFNFKSNYEVPHTQILNI